MAGRKNKIVPGVTTVSSAGTAVTLSSTDYRASSITIKAARANTNAIYIGDSTVDSDTGKIFPDQSITFDFTQNHDISAIYVDADTDGNKAEWWVVI
jgi:hypothetical protein|tara:strand:- start:1047 stop:1337 length:291 start_codon:yes stop_codon:yes gene_type:complete